MPLPPDPILRRPCADREEKRVTHGRDMRSNKQLAAGRPRQNGHAEGQCLVGENMLSNAKIRARHVPANKRTPSRRRSRLSPDHTACIDRLSHPQEWHEAVAHCSRYRLDMLTSGHAPAGRIDQNQPLKPVKQKKLLDPDNPNQRSLSVGIPPAPSIAMGQWTPGDTDPRDDRLRRMPSCLQGGRDGVGMVAGFKSERWPTSSWNRWPACIGICTR
jgi:hypothetical protein